MNARGPDKACHAAWKIDSVRRDEWTSKLSEAQKERLRGGMSDETKARMATAKMGRRNPKATPVLVRCPDGSTKHFETVTAAAGFFGVTQQAMDLWLRGKSSWPTAGGKTKEHNRRLAGLTGEYLD